MRRKFCTLSGWFVGRANGDTGMGALGAHSKGGLRHDGGGRHGDEKYRHGHREAGRERLSAIVPCELRRATNGMDSAPIPPRAASERAMRQVDVSPDMRATLSPINVSLSPLSPSPSLGGPDRHLRRSKRASPYHAAATAKSQPSTPNLSRQLDGLLLARSVHSTESLDVAASVPNMRAAGLLASPPREASAPHSRAASAYAGSTASLAAASPAAATPAGLGSSLLSCSDSSPASQEPLTQPAPAALPRAGAHRHHGGCPFMEDEVCLHPPHFFAVYDGHGGGAASKLAAEQLHLHVLGSAAFARGDATAALLAGFEATEEALRQAAVVAAAAAAGPAPPRSPRSPRTPSARATAGSSGGGDGPVCVGRAMSGKWFGGDRGGASGSSPRAEAESRDAGGCGSGSTAVVALLLDQTLHVAWLGDCRAVRRATRSSTCPLPCAPTSPPPDASPSPSLAVAKTHAPPPPLSGPLPRQVLCRAGVAEPLTLDHRLDDERERQRVASEGGTIEGDRLGGFLHCSRALGDLDGDGRKPAGLSAVPDVRSTPLEPEHEFVVLGSDGLWDVLEPAVAVAMARDELRAYGDAAMASEKLVEAALARKTDDNVTVLVLPLGAVAPPPVRCATPEPPRSPPLPSPTPLPPSPSLLRRTR